jgi:NAD(P)H-dependent flavin oxidoreductase YrpB (nitropropane dioxygenase family)
MGEIQSMSLLVGQPVGLVSEIQPAADIIRGMVDATQRLINQLRLLIVAE